jgi:signal transduction histidine kinase
MLTAVVSDSLINYDLRDKGKKALVEIESLMSHIKNEDDQIQSLLSEFSQKGQYIDLIQERLSQLNQQITEVYETVGIGLAAQALAHEVHPFVDNLVAITKSVQERLGVAGFNIPQIAGDLELIKSQSIMIGKKISYIDPMLRTFREIKQNIKLKYFLDDFFALKKDRLERFNIKTYVEYLSGKDISITMNKGRLTQIIDNLTRNSEYWLRQLNSSKPKPLEIHAVIDSPKLIFWDTGPGVRQPLEEVLFDIFVTDKPSGEGHGLGLFIVKQLLDEEGCRIYLSEEKNESGRRFKFIIDFSGVLNE